jgi:hypothetical protein
MDERDTEKPPTGFPEPPGIDPEDRTRDRDPHHVLNNPVGEPDPTEWPDPYDVREDPLDASGVAEDPPHPPTGATSTSEPHPDADPELGGGNAPERDRLDE